MSPVDQTGKAHEQLVSALHTDSRLKYPIFSQVARWPMVSMRNPRIKTLQAGWDRQTPTL